MQKRVLQTPHILWDIWAGGLFNNNISTYSILNLITLKDLSTFIDQNLSPCGTTTMATTVWRVMISIKVGCSQFICIVVLQNIKLRLSLYYYERGLLVGQHHMPLASVQPSPCQEEGRRDAWLQRKQEDSFILHTSINCKHDSTRNSGTCLFLSAICYRA